MRKDYKTTWMAICLAVLTTTAAGQGPRQPLSEEQKQLNTMHQVITSDKLFHYVEQLSDPSLEGRLAGSPGMAKAVAIVEDYYKRWGLRPAGDEGGYIQEYPHPCVEIGPGSGMEILFPIRAKEKDCWIAKSYPWAEGWFAGGMSGNGDITAEVVYAGFGVTAPELGYDDYQGIDVRGKIVLVEGETPNRSREPEAIAQWYHHTLHQTKLNNAVAHGAIGLLYKWVPGPNAPYNEGFVYCHVTDTVVDDLFRGTGRTYEETVGKIYETMKPQSFAMGKRARIKMNATYNPDATGKNIVGVVEGSDPVLRNEYVIVAAHLDHLGMIPYHIEGANDNNASTAALLGAAEAIAKLENKPKRSVVFLSLDGEEAGLTGSTYYTSHPIFPKERVKAVLNLEQVGAGEILVANYAYDHPALAKATEAANGKYIHRQLIQRENHYLTRPRTDGAVFMKAGYPCVDLRAAGGGYYHHPKDNTASINPEILESTGQWLFWTVLGLANE